MKVLILQNKLLHYRIPLYNAINAYEDIDLTVAHPDKKVEEDGLGFHQVILNTYKKGPFTLHEGLYDFCCGFDVVIAMFDIKWLTHMKLAFMRRKPFQLIFWGIGVSTEKGFDVDKRFDNIRYFLARQADALLFYSDYPVKKYVNAGFNRNKLFVANNTVFSSVEQLNRKDKKTFLFVGSLERRKRIYELLDAFHQAMETTLKGQHYQLHIIGAGSEKDNIREYIVDKGLERDVILHGSINEEEQLNPFFEKAIACISPGQAGLSVLSSFALGVPFVTRYDAITGGERFNIINEYNGIIYEGKDQELVKILIKLATETDYAESMGVNARFYYLQHRTIGQMAEGFYKAVCFVKTQKKQ